MGSVLKTAKKVGDVALKTVGAPFYYSTKAVYDVGKGLVTGQNPRQILGQVGQDAAGAVSLGLAAKKHSAPPDVTPPPKPQALVNPDMTQLDTFLGKRKKGFPGGNTLLTPGTASLGKSSLLGN